MRHFHKTMITILNSYRNLKVIFDTARTFSLSAIQFEAHFNIHTTWRKTAK